jgi:hypothetical protein
MTITENTSLTLTPEATKALREADNHVAFIRENGIGHIRAVARLDSKHRPSADLFPDVVFDAGWAERSIPASTLVTNYGSDHIEADRRLIYVVSSPQFTPEWLTVARFLKPGDIVTLDFTLSNGGERLAEVGYQMDEMRLRVLRGKALHIFLVGVVVAPVDGVMRFATGG